MKMPTYSGGACTATGPTACGKESSSQFQVGVTRRRALLLGFKNSSTAARHQVLPALHHAASQLGVPTLADKGYIGAGIGIHVPVKKPGGDQAHDVDTRTHELSEKTSLFADSLSVTIDLDGRPMPLLPSAPTGQNQLHA